MTVTQTGRRLALVGLIALVASLLPLTAASGDGHITAQTDLDINDALDISDPVQASILYSELAYPNGGVTTVVLATSADGADALASGVFQDDSAFLFYNPDEGVIQAHIDEITRLGATEAIVLGGEAAIPAEVADALEGLGLTVTRYGGESRIQTMALIAEAVGGDSAYLTRAFGTDTDSNTAFADSAGAGLLAAANDLPILGSQTEVLTGDTATALEDFGGVTPFGGPAALSEDVLSAVPEGTTVNERIAGETRASTLVAANNAAGYDTAADASYVVAIDIFNGDFFVDAYASVQLVNSLGAAYLPVNGDDITPEGEAFLGGGGFAQDGSNQFICLVGASDAVCDAVAEALGLDPADTESEMLTEDVPPMSNQTFSVTPLTATTLIDDDVAPGETDDQRVYTVENPVAGAEHTVALFNEDRISMSAEGIVQFLDANGDVEDGAAATLGTVASSIVVINGAPGDDDQQDEATPINNFTVDGDGFESFYPVVFFDEDGDGNLDLDGNGFPTAEEIFGVGGLVIVEPAESATDTPTDEIFIEEVQKDSNKVIGFEDTDNDDTLDGGEVRSTFFYDSNDLFYLGSIAPANQITLDEFEAALTAGDELATGTVYQANPDFVSTFILTNQSPPAPVINSNDPAETSVEVTVDDANLIDGATINVFVGPDDNNAFDDTQDELNTSVTADEDTDTGDFQVTVTGLDPATSYDIFVTQTVDGEESDASNRSDATTDATPDDVMVDSVTINDINNGAGMTEIVLVTFDTDVTDCDASLVTVYPTLQPGLTIPVDDCDFANFDADAMVVAFDLADGLVNDTAVEGDNGGSDGHLDDSATDIEYTIEIDAGAITTAGGLNADLTSTFNY